MVGCTQKCLKPVNTTNAGYIEMYTQNCNNFAISHSLICCLLLMSLLVVIVMRILINKFRSTINKLYKYQ